jgi:hypothetical protein
MLLRNTFGTSKQLARALRAYIYLKINPRVTGFLNFAEQASPSDRDFALAKF